MLVYDSWGGATPSKAVSQYWNGDIPWLSSGEIKGWHVTQPTHHVTQVGAEAARLRRCPPGSVFVVVRSGVLARTLPVAQATFEAVVNQDVKAFDSGSQSLNTWLAFCLRAMSQDILEANRKDGTTVQSVRYEPLKATVIPVPPMAEQKRIVAKVEELLEQVNAALERLAKVPALLKRFRQSVLAAACSGRLTEEGRETNSHLQLIEDSLRKIERGKRGLLRVRRADASIDALELSNLPDGWAWVQNYRLATDSSNSICAGPFGTIFKAKDFRDVGVPIIFLRHVAAGSYKTVSPGFMHEGVWRKFHQEYSVYGGELLVTKLGDPPGTACIYSTGAGVAMVTPDVMKMEVDRRVTIPEYLMHFFNSPICKGIVTVLAFGATRLRIDLSMFKHFPIPLPPIEEQQEIVRHVQALFALADAIEKRVAQATARVGKTTQAILTKAFRGEIVPTEAELAQQEGRDYESASVLLERIRAERAASSSGRVGRAKRTHRSQPKGAPSPQPVRARPSLDSANLLPSWGQSPVEAGGATPAPTPAHPRGNIPQAILAHMKPGIEYSPGEILDALGLSTTEWTWAIAQLKEGGRVIQSGQRRAARYVLPNPRLRSTAPARRG